MWHEGGTNTGVDARPGVADVFISYRREYVKAAAISQYLIHDAHGIRPGRRWNGAIKQALSSCKAFLVLIGEDFVKSSDEVTGQRNADTEGDAVREEIRLENYDWSVALGRGKTRNVAASSKICGLTPKVMDMSLRSRKPPTLSRLVTI